MRVAVIGSRNLTIFNLGDYLPAGQRELIPVPEITQKQMISNLPSFSPNTANTEEKHHSTVILPSLKAVILYWPFGTGFRREPNSL